MAKRNYRVCLGVLLVDTIAIVLTIIFLLSTYKWIKTSNEVAKTLTQFMNRSVDPCDDFYEYVCGGMKSFFDNQDKIVFYDSTLAIDRAVRNNVHSILSKPIQQDDKEYASKAKKFYKACLEEDSILENSRKGVNAVMESLSGLYVEKDSTLPYSWKFHDLLLKRDAYIAEGIMSYNILMSPMDYQYHIHVTPSAITPMTISDLNRTLLLLNKSDSDTNRLQDVVNLSNKLLQITKITRKHESPRFWTVLKLQELNREFPNIMNWSNHFHNLIDEFQISLGNMTVLVLDKSYFYELDKFLHHTDNRITIQNYIVFLVLKDMEKRFTVRNIKHFLDVKKSCIEETKSALGWAVSSLYVDEYFGDENKITAEEIVPSVISAFQQMLNISTWIEDDTKKEAVKKIGSLKILSGYPEFVKNDSFVTLMYRDLQVTTSFVNNTVNKVKHERRSRLKTLWRFPLSANAFYYPYENTLKLLAPLLTIPNIFPKLYIPSAINYGALGTIIAHEMAHAITYRGSTIDSNGRLRNWWGNSSQNTFDAKTQCIAEQFARFQYFGNHVNGFRTVKENVADMASLKAGFIAHEYANKQRGGLHGVKLTNDQLFFVGYARKECAFITDKIMTVIVGESSHAPSPARVNGPLSNLPEFAKAFGCKEGSSMNPVSKCSLF